MKTNLLLILLITGFINAFAQNDLRIIKPYESDEDTISICYRDTITVKVMDFSEFASLNWYNTSPVEPDLVGWSNDNLWERHYLHTVNPDSSFSIAIDKELWIFATLYNLGTVYTNVIHVTPLGNLPTLVYTDTIFCSGSSLTISANPNNLGSDNYKWFKNSIEIENEILPDLEINESGIFKVGAKDVNGACPTKFIMSDPQQFYLEKPEITGDLIPVLSRITLSTDDLYTSYQWYSGDDRDNLVQQVSSTTATSYVVNISDNDMYYALSVITQSGCNAISDTFLINKKKYDAPVITHPVLLDICPESTLMLHTDDFYGSYQWYRDGIVIPNENNDTIILTGKYPYDSGKYTVKVTTELDANSVFESDTVVINAIDNPFIKSYGDAYCLGAEISFYTQGIYDSYQWYINNESDFTNAVPVGTDDSTYTFNVVEDELYYMLSATHTSCPETLYSNDLYVKPYQYASKVTIGTDDDDLNQKVCYGDSVKLRAKANDAEPHWYFNGNLIDSLVEKEIYVEEYGLYTLSVTSTKCPELDPILSEDTVAVGSKINVSFSVNPDGEEYYINNNPNHLIFCGGDPIKLSVNNPDNFNSWQWMGKLFSETSTLDEWEDLENGNDSIFSFLNGNVPKLRFKVQVDSVMGDGKTCTGVSSLKIIDSYVYLAPEFYVANQNTNQFCGEGDSILLKVGVGEWGKYEWLYYGEVLPNSNSDEYYAKDTGYYQVAAYFEKCLHNPPSVSGAMQLLLFEEALIYVEDEKIVATPNDDALNFQWYYSSENPTNGGGDILDNMVPVDADTLLRPYEIPFDQASVGYYVIEIKNADYCVNISDVYYHNPNSITNVELNGVNIYPNPINDILNIEMANPKSVTSIKIFSASGILIQSISNISTQISIPMNNFENGIYFIKLDYGDLGSEVEKFIKK